ncbi:MAG: hypothetical protein MUE46_12850 [Xanthomonadales bacterium]|nr:hypothetical protein [Xanthomonadales bacterium]
MSGNEATWQVVFRGKLLSGFAPEQVAQNLAALFKTDTARTAALLTQPKVVLKAGVSREVGERYQAALRQAGLVVALISEAPIAAGVAAAESAPTPPAPTTAAAAPAPAPVSAPRPMPATLPATGPAVAAPPAAAPSLAAPGALLSDTKPVRPVEIDTSRLKLDAPGVVIDTRPKPRLERNFDLSGLSVDQSGAPIAVKPKAEPPKLDLSGLSVDPIEVKDKPPSAFWSKIESAG